MTVTAEMRNLVSMCKAMGLTDEQTARQVNFAEGGIAKSTLYKHFKPELDDGGYRIHARVAANMARIAMDGAHKGTVLAGMFWLKSRLGWQMPETVDIAVGLPGKNGPGKNGKLPPAHFTLRIGDRSNGVDDDAA